MLFWRWCIVERWLLFPPGEGLIFICTFLFLFICFFNFIFFLVCSNATSTLILLQNLLIKRVGALKKLILVWRSIWAFNSNIICKINVLKARFTGDWLSTFTIWWNNSSFICDFVAWFLSQSVWYAPHNCRWVFVSIWIHLLSVDLHMFYWSNWTIRIVRILCWSWIIVILCWPRPL